MDIFDLLKKGESETVEFKARFNKETIISLAAFANTKGGKVIGKSWGRPLVFQFLSNLFRADS